MNNRLKNLIKYAVFIGLAVLLLWLAFRNTQPEKLINDLKQANYSIVFLSMIMGYTAIISRGYRWLILLEPMGYKPKAWNSIHSVAILYIVNIAVPRAGELARCTSLNQAEDIPVDKLFGTVIVERIVDFIMLAIIMAITFIVYLDELLQFFSMAVSGDSGEAGGSEVKWYLATGAVLLGALVFIFRNKIISHPKFVVIRNFWLGMKEGLLSFKTMKRKTAFILHSFYIWLMYYGMVYVVFFALPQTAHFGPQDAFFVMVAASLGIVVPVPGGIGAYHYLVMLALSILGLSKADGLTYATIVHSSQTLQLLVGGALGFLFLYLQRRKTA